MALILQWSFVPVTHIHVLSLRCWFYCIHCRLSTLLYPPCNKFLTQHSDFSMSTTTWSESSSLVWSHSCRLGRGHYTKGTTATTPTVCDGTLNFKQYWYFFLVPNNFDTDTGTFFGTKFFRYRFRYQILPIPVPRMFSGTEFFRYRFPYHHKKWKFPIPVPIRYRYPI